jgi:hypothetical protein
MRTLLRARTFVALVAIGLVVALGGGTAYAYWSASGSGSGSATTATLNPPTGVTVPAISGNTVHVTWTASATTGAPTPSGYYVTRSGVPACGTSSAATISATSCDDTAAAGTYTYTVTAVYHSWTAASAASGAVIVRTATKLEFTGQPSNTSAGSAISPAVAVTVEDAAGNAVPVAGRSVTVAIGTNPGGTLSGTTTANTDASGVATFNNLSINNAGVGYTLATTSSGITGATSIAFNVIGAAAKLVITSSPVGGTASTSATLGPITIQRQDSVGNPVTGSVTVGLASTSAGFKFAAASGGTAISSITIPANQSTVDVYYGDTVAGTPTITASSSGLSSATQVEAITAATASKFVITSAPVAGVASSSPTLGPITIQRQDTFGNPVTTGDSVTVALGSSAGTSAKFATTSGGSTIASATILAGASSVDVYYGDTAIGSPTITVSLSGLTSATQIEKIGKLCFVNTTTATCLTSTQIVGNGGTFSGRVELVDSANNPITATSAISVTLTRTADLQAPSITPVTIAALDSVSGAFTDGLSNGSSKSGTLTAHAGSGTTGDVTITIHA